MSEHFVKYINIEKYKCFEGFSAEGFKRVNLISGKNNVGKTALMEALYLNVTSPDIPNILEGLYILKKLRNRAEYSYKVINIDSIYASIKSPNVTVQTTTNINSMSFTSKKGKLEREYEFSVSSEETVILESAMNIGAIVNNISPLKFTACYIPSVRDAEHEIVTSYSAVQKKDRETEVDGYIRCFDDSLENVKLMGGSAIEFKVPLENGGFEYRPLSELGDGVRHYLSVISDLFAAEGGYIFIDELDNGIHYSSLDQFWKIILELSKELNVQVFATTHSKECIESYCRVAETLKDEDINFITLVKNKEKEVKAIVRDYEVFTNSIHADREVRGW